MTDLIEMAELRRRLGMEGRETRLIVRRLRAIADERKGAFPLFRLAGRYVSTRAALLELIPELAGEDELATLRDELATLRRRVEVLERRAR